MPSLIIVHADFEAQWPFVAEDWCTRWRAEDETVLIRLPRGNTQPVGEVITETAAVTRLACLGMPITAACVQLLTALREATVQTAYIPCKLNQAFVKLLYQQFVNI